MRGCPEMGLKYEKLFMLEFVRMYFKNGDSKKLKKFLAKSDMKSLVGLIEEQGVTSFFYHTARSGDVQGIPEDLLKLWRGPAGRIAIDNMLYEGEMAKLVRELDHMNIKYVFLKGLPLMNNIYGNTWIRPTSDMDIYTSREDYPRIKEYLTGQGFEFMPLDDFVDLNDEKFKSIHEGLHPEIHFIKKSGARCINIDIHWGIGGFIDNTLMESLFPVDGYPWGSEISHVSMNGENICCLKREMEFLHIVFHFAFHHQFSGFKWFLDICQFIYRYGDILDWSYIGSVVKEPNCRRTIGVTYSLCSNILGKEYAKCPEGFGTGIGTPGEFALYRRRLFSSKSRIGKYLCYSLLPARLGDRWRMLMFPLFNANAVPGFYTSGRGWRRVLQPFYVIYRSAAELFTGADKKKALRHE
jgi:hypothetical protein